MRKIAVCAHFLTDAHRRKIRETAQSLGFGLTFYDDIQSPDAQAALVRDIGEYEILYGYVPLPALKNAANLKWLCTASAGVEHLLRPDAGLPPDCLLSNASGAYGPTISEHILMVLLMLMRRMPEYIAAGEKREWPFYTPIRSITGSRVVVVGTGDIGTSAARRLRALGAAVTGVCRSGKNGDPAFDRVLPVEALDTVLPDADAVILALPATPETVNILSRERLAILPPTAYIVNVGRGSAIDQGALVEALQARRIAGAALDVMTPEPLPRSHPLWDCPNTILTPHVSGNMSLGLTRDLTVDIFCRDLVHYAKGEPLENLVDRKKGY